MRSSDRAAQDAAPAQRPAGDTSAQTGYLKGLAIIVIFFHHYILEIFPGTFSLYGHQFVTLFFILSGYGVFYSVKKELAQGALRALLPHYLLKRALRIYPLYWLWLLLGLLKGSQSLAELRLFNDVLLLGFEESPQWFLVPLVHCYILAPFIYLAARRNAAVFGAGLSILMVCLHLLLVWQGVPSNKAVAYLGVFGSHLYLFSLGVLLHFLPAAKGGKGALALCTLAALAMLCAFDQLNPHFTPLVLGNPAANFAALLAPALFIHRFLPLNPAFLPLKALFRYAGRHSYAIFLFHGKFIYTLKHAHPALSTLSNALLLAALFCLCLLLCAALETASGWLARGLMGRFEADRAAPR
ncbi:MAG TPA: acyltransferase [Humidesulfovibrio sp.]|uniref:acyltransferase family protein n=1 Tax=Humidesulfovibrio sp. TaxID=2910988 RepID=UPI002D100A14|nr:acyltransferase [Humidesulfovibrio sp.]HWR04512.1 acyltransferase [Humidesulfovibrio sp.]